MSRPVQSNCSNCGRTYLARKDRLKEGKPHFCSHSCTTTYYNKLNYRGSGNPNWKGGISFDKYHYKKLQLERYPEKVSARKILAQAIRSGNIVKQSCEVCGDLVSFGHHDDYSKPLEVRWLCRKHHRELHNNRH